MTIRRAVALLAVVAPTSLPVFGTSASVATASTALSQAARPPTLGEKYAIERVVLLLFRAIRNRDYQAACQQYTPLDRALLVLVAQHSFDRPSTHDCAQALAVIITAKGARKLAVFGTPRFKRITISGKVATVSITETTPSGRTARDTVTLTHGRHGWKLGLSISPKLR